MPRSASGVATIVCSFWVAVVIDRSPPLTSEFTCDFTCGLTVRRRNRRRGQSPRLQSTRTIGLKRTARKYTGERLSRPGPRWPRGPGSASSRALSRPLDAGSARSRRRLRSRSSPSAPTAAHGRRANPSAAASTASSTVVDRRWCDASSRPVASARSSPWMCSRQRQHARRRLGDRHRVLGSRVSPGERDRHPTARSRGPTSTRTGTPFSSQSTTRRPNDRSVRVSISVRTSTPLSSRASRSAASRRAVLAPHEQHDDLDRSEPGRDAQPGVVAVAHDQPADHPGGRAPRGLPHVLERARLGRVLGVEHLGEVLAELVARAHLQRLAVAHHRLDRRAC